LSEHVQRRIAELAVEREFLDPSQLSEIMLELGRRLEAGGSVDVNVWVDREWLEPVELSAILDDLDVPYAAGNRRTGDRGADSGDEFSRIETEVRGPSRSWEELPPETGPEDQLGELSADFESTSESEKLREPARSGADRPSSERNGGGDGDPTETLTEPPKEFVDETRTDRDDEREAPAVRSDEIETVAAAGDDETPTQPEDSPARAGFRPTRAVFRAAERDDPINSGERFVLRRELGSGGAGRVVRAYDRLLGRTVAMKILRAEVEEDPESLSRFIAEAQATGQLEHPNIVPIYDFGVLPSGDAFYTMREVEGHSLRRVLTAIAEDDQEYRDEYTLVRLLNILRQVSQAAQYAHVRSVVHRDLKPDNIMLGDYGEVLVMDWGLAQLLETAEVEPGREFAERSSPGQSGKTLGTPSYMPPEQARGDLDEVDERSDIYSLGAILYEILTLAPPFSGDGPLDVMWAVVDEELVEPSTRAPDDREVPEGLERICLKAMAEDQVDRYETAGAFHEDLEAWLEGLKPRQAEELVEKGDRAAERYHRLRHQIETYNERVRHLSNQIDDWTGVEEKRRLWEVEDERDEAEAESARAFCAAVTHYQQALAQEPGHEAANQGLADLYWTRLRRAELRRDELNTIYFKTLVEQYDPGTYKELLAANSDLRVQTDPEGVDLTLFEYRERERRLIPTDDRDLGETPVEVEDLPIGSYLLKLEPDRCRNIQRPLFVERDRDAEVDIDLPRESDFEEGFRYIPAGKYISGGDPNAFAPRRPERVHVDSFFCQTVPVTFADYLAWFNELYERRGEEAMERAPQTREAEGLLISYDDDRDQWVPSDVLIEGKARERYPTGEGHEWDLPIIGVRAEDAEAYIEWRSERDGRDYRLPTVHELEKAGRGVDGRQFPWGDKFDATFCKMRLSRAEKPPQPEPVGTFEKDVSPYGVQDLAGGVQEWCQPTEDSGEMQRPVKGGGWSQDERVCHLAGVVELLVESRSSHTGFRMVYEAESAES